MLFQYDDLNMDKGEQGSHEKNRQHPCGRAISTAPDILKATYDTSVHFTWGLASFNCLRSSFFPDGVRTQQASNALSVRVLLESKTCLGATVPSTCIQFYLDLTLITPLHLKLLDPYPEL